MPKSSSGAYSPNSGSPSHGAKGGLPPQNGEPAAIQIQKYAALPEETEALLQQPPTPHPPPPPPPPSPPRPSTPLVEEHEVDKAFEGRRGCCSKYGNALKICIPCRPERKDKRKLPSNKAGLISFFSLTWLTRLMWKAFTKGLTQEDLWQLQEEDSASHSCARVQRLWSREQSDAPARGRAPELWRAVWRSARTRVLVTVAVSLLVNMLQFVGPSVLLKLCLDYIASPEVDLTYASCLVGTIFGVSIVRAASFNLMFVIGSHTATRVTGGVQSLVYRKVLRLKTGGEKLSAQITNILSNDMERLFEAVISAVFITTSPVIFLLSAVYSVFLIGPWALVGMACYFLFYPVMAGIAKAQSGIRVKTVKKTDKRVGLMGEILNNLRLIKMYAWEGSFAEKIAGIRKEELKRHRLGALMQAVSSTTVPSISILATICTILGYTLTGHPLSASVAFTMYSVFNAMQFTVGVLPFTIRSVAEAKISLARIQKLLSLPEHEKRVSCLVASRQALVIKNATFAWEMHSIQVKDDRRAAASKDDGAKDESTPNSKKKTPPKSDSENGLLLSSSSSDPPHPQISPKKGGTLPQTLSSPIKSSSSPHKGGTLSPPSSPQKGGSPSPHDSSVEVTETLFGINLSVERGRLVGICGSVGAGKSSLLSALCGDMRQVSGDVQVNGRLALVTQQAWIYNASLRENILVGANYEEGRYTEVVEACGLKEDLDALPKGDLTEIGDRGVNLSGGQKQRVSLARAAYSSPCRSVFLLDDPLSAVDTKVANHIFTRCVRGLLRDKTVILVTHGTHFLSECDEVVLMKGGRICERGSHVDLMARRGEYFDLMGFNPSPKGGGAAPEEVHLEKTQRKRKESEMDDGSKVGGGEGKLIKEEGKEVGGVSAKVYCTFIKVSGGWCWGLVVFLSIVAFTLIRIFNIVWLQMWLDAGDGLESLRRANASSSSNDSASSLTEEEFKGDITLNEDLWIYQLVYGMSFIVLIATGIAKGVGVTFSVLTGASRLHLDMFHSILRSPMSFLDATPAGRILNRFSRDMDEVDVRVPFFLEFVLQGILSVFGQIVLVCVLFPVFVAPLLVILGLFIWVDHFLNSGVRELKRLDNNLKSPVIQHLTASISGLTVIRTFDRENVFVRRFDAFLDSHSVALLVFRLSNRWFTYRMDVLASLVTLGITVITVFNKGNFSVAVAGLALATVNGVCSFIPFLMRMKSEFASRFTSVERIVEYAYNLEPEAPAEIEGSSPPKGWPSEGAIEIRDVSLRYRPDLPLVLRGISAHIKPCEKIGIVGRTGAGKSSLITSLLRLVELDDGCIKIDGIDIRTLGLHPLRSAISVIPQDPVLFQGSIRYNLDPFDEHPDEAVWMAIERSNLKRAINKLPLKLMSEVEAAGENFSVGEKQLLCLARALLRNSKILLLDEATASVDMETDQLIQDTIRTAFAACTVVTVAHRLNTVAAYNRVLVLDKGKVAEFDTPSALMRTEGSIFKEMMAAMGVHTHEQMQALS